MAAKVVVCDSLEDLLNQVFGVHLRDGNDTAGEPQVEPIQQGGCCTSGNCDCAAAPVTQEAPEDEDEKPAYDKDTLLNMVFDRDYPVDLSFAEIVMLRQAIRKLPAHYANGVVQTVTTAKSLAEVKAATQFAVFSTKLLTYLDKRLAAEIKDVGNEVKEYLAGQDLDLAVMVTKNFG